MLHFSTSDQKKCFSGPVWDPQILQNRSRNVPRGAQVAPRWRPNRPLDLQDGRPDEPRAFQTSFQTAQEPILEVPGPSKPRFWPPGDPFCLRFGGPKRHFGRPETNFPAPRHPFSSPDFPLPQSSMPPSLSKPFQTFPSLQTSNAPSLQASKCFGEIRKA